MHNCYAVSERTFESALSFIQLPVINEEAAVEMRGYWLAIVLVRDVRACTELTYALGVCDMNVGR